MARVISSGWQGDEYMRRLDIRIRQVLTKAALDIEGDAVINAHVITGNLRNNMYSRPTEKQGDTYTSEAGNTAEYAQEEEYRDGHAFLRPAFDRNAPYITRALKG